MHKRSKHEKTIVKGGEEDEEKDLSLYRSLTTYKLSSEVIM